MSNNHKPDLRIEVTEQGAKVTSWDWDWGPHDVTHYEVDAVPEKVAQSLATLMVLPTGGYVEGLGWRVSQNVFWVFKEHRNESND